MPWRLARSAKHGDVLQWVAVDDHQIGELAGLHRSELVVAAHQLGAVLGRPPDHVEIGYADLPARSRSSSSA